VRQLGAFERKECNHSPHIMRSNSVDHAGNESDRSSGRGRRRLAQLKRHLSVSFARSRSRSNSKSPTYNEQSKQQAALAAIDVLARARSGQGGLLVNSGTVRTMSPLAMPAHRSMDSAFWGESTDHNGHHNGSASSSCSDDNDESSSDDEHSRHSHRRRSPLAVKRTKRQPLQQQKQKQPMLKSRWWLIGSAVAAVVCAAAAWQLAPRQQQHQQQQQHEVVWHYATQPPARAVPQQQQPSSAAAASAAADINAGLFNSMFDSVDENHDGSIKRQEMRDFVSARGSGGAASRLSDGLSDIDAGVTSTMHNIDINDDDNLTKADLLAYWGRLGSLLTVDEVADWVLHAVQLPLEVAHAFKAHSVTGYDFIDLMANSGALLEQELGITKATFRKRLVQRMEWKMWAMGTEPAPPTTVKWSSRLGGGLVVTWQPPHADKHSFPVHKYLLKRRLLRSNSASLAVLGDDSSCTTAGIGTSTAAGGVSALSCSSSVDAAAVWITVLDGPGTTCVDGRLQSDSAYLYSLQAWNALGHSEAVTFEYVTDSEPADSSSNSYYYQYYTGSGSSSGTAWRLELVGYTAATVIAGCLLYIVLKAQDSSSSSSSSSNSSRKQAASGNGYDSPPQQQQQQQQQYEQQYEQQQQQCSGVYASPATPARPLLHLSASPGKCRTVPTKNSSEQLHEQELSSVRQRFRSSSLSPIRDSIGGATSKLNPRLPPMRSYSGDSTTVKKHVSSSSSSGVVSGSIMRRVAARRAHSQQDFPTSSTGSSAVAATSTLYSALSRSDGAMSERLHASDDSGGCYICRSCAKWYSTRHTCRSCHKPFCHKHGRTTHTLPVCPVGSNCVCQVCIAEWSSH
jgi:hypothetical protein